MSKAGNETALGPRPVSDEDRMRADLYRLLAALLARPPDGELLRLLQGIDPPEGPMSDVWRELRRKAQEIEPSRIDDEYHALFIGLGRGELNPYASWYLTGYLMEKPLADLRNELRRLGITRMEGVSEPEDHVSALCETMALILSENRLSFNESKNFFAAFLGSWLEKFFRDLENASSADFFRSVGGLGSGFIGIEKAYYAMPV